MVPGEGSGLNVCSIALSGWLLLDRKVLTPRSTCPAYATAARKPETPGLLCGTEDVSAPRRKCGSSKFQSPES